MFQQYKDIVHNLHQYIFWSIFIFTIIQNKINYLRIIYLLALQ